MIVKTSLDYFLKSGEYLPKPLRDFHDQKEVFRAMHEIVGEQPGSFVKRPSWIEGQVYVIDVFLWFMARRGWTLQRSRKPCEFRDLEADVAAKMEQMRAAESAVLMQAMKEPNK